MEKLVKRKCETCRFVKSIGEYAAFVTTACSKARMIKGTLVTPKHYCESCPDWEDKNAGGEHPEVHEEK